MTTTGPELASAAAAAAGTVLPSAVPLNAAPAQPGNEHVAAAFSGGVIAHLNGPKSGPVALLVGADLVNALKQSPIGGLDLAAATQPAVDQLARVLELHASPATECDLGSVIAELGGPFTAVPLIGAGIDAAVLFPDHLLQPAPVAAPEPAFVEEPTFATPAAEVEPPLAPAGNFPPPAPVTSVVPPVGTPIAVRGIEMLHGVEMEVTVELGRARMTVRELLALTPGTVLELDRAAGSPADLLVNGRLIARGEVVVVDEDFGLRITEVLDEAAAS